MAQDRADAGQGRTLAKHCGGSGVSENVGAIDRGLDPNPAQRGTHDTTCVTAARVSGRTGASTVVNTSGVRNGGLLWRR